jgi:HAMP domain-containing protein
MQRRLQEIAAANTSHDVLAQVEHFQNQLIVQRDNIDAIKHAVKKDEERLEKNLSGNPVAADHRTLSYHEREKNEVDAFENNFNALRDELKKFLLKYL